MECIIKGVANEVIREKKVKRHEEWFDRECVKCIAEKNKAGERMIQRESRINYENYREKRRQANRIYRRKKEMIQKQQRKLNNLINKMKEGNFTKQQISKQEVFNQE
jgi:hypothetical protein